jgi:putative ABC transport system permease protein
MLSDLFSDAFYALRILLRRPAFTIAAILSLALGIGVTTAIFSVVNAVALRPLPYPDPDRLVWMSELLHGSSTDEFSLTSHFLEWRSQTKSFADLAGYRFQTRNLTGVDDAVEVSTGLASASLLPILGVSPALGRNFTDKEDSKGNDRVALLTDSLWRNRFAADPNIAGRPITLDGVPFIIVGVLPRGFVFPGSNPVAGAVDLITPLGKNPNAVLPNVLGRLNSAVTIDQATAELLVINSRTPKPPWILRISLDMLPLKDHLYGNAKTAGWILFAAAGFLLWIACANVSNLLLARLTQRDREFAIRAALGGSRARLIGQLLVKSSLLAVVACGAGIAIAFALRGPILAFIPYKLAGLDALPFDGRVFAFAILAGVVTVILFGILPAFRATQSRLASSIKAGESTTVGGRGSARILSTLAAAEIAVLLILSTGAGLTLKSFWKLRYQNLGISPDQLTAMSIVPSGPRYMEEGRSFQFAQQLLDRAQAIPGVESAALTDADQLPPGAFHATNVFEIQDRPPVAIDSGQRPIARYPHASPNLFSILHIAVLNGRLFDSSDRLEVCVINRALATKYFRGENPIGHRLRWGGNDSSWYEIIGIVSDVKLSGLEAAAEPAVYHGFNRTDPMGRIGLILKSPLDAQFLAPDLRRVVAAVDPNQSISKIESINSRLSESVAKPRFVAMLLGAFAVLAAILGIIGVYSVVSCRVRWQLREMAIRQALGAQPGDVMRHVLRQGMTMIAIGIACGVATSLALSRVLARLLYEVKPNDPATLIGAALVLTTVALAACWLPARRASKVDPLVLLRYE